MRYFKLSILTLAFIALHFGCGKDLDLKPIARDTEVTFYKDADAIDQTVTAAYAQLCAREVFDKAYYLVIGSLQSDDVEAGGEDINDYPIAQRYDQLIHGIIDSEPAEDIWAYCYKGCRMANTALEKMQIPDIASAEFISKRTAEMKYMRALYHFILVQVFGGVPIADKTIQPDNFFKPRNTIKEVLSFCEQDLIDAIAALPVSNPSEPGRATKGAAQSLLSKVLLYESSYAANYPNDERFIGCLERWQEALDYAEAVINSGVYQLVGIDGERFSSWRTYPDAEATIDGYRWLFTADGDNSPESIFEVQNVNDGFGWGVSRGNVLTVFQTARYYIKPDGEYADIGGWSFNLPTDHLVAAFRNADPRQTNLSSTPGPEGSETDDPRFSTTVGRAGDSILVYEDVGLVRHPISFHHLPTGTIGRKFECGYDEFWSDGQWMQGPFNLRLIRYADVVLFAAEAAYMTGDQAKALEYVNMVRTRARNCGTTGKPENLSAVTFEDIVHERRLELALEPHRFFDLVRWNLAYTFINGIPKKGVGGGFTVDFIRGMHEFSPLPNSQVILSKGALKQYPAWE